MDAFCGDVRNAWGVSAKGYLTHCFDDLVLFGVTYVFIFTAGSYRAWTLLHIPTCDEFPYSTRHSVKVMLLGWLGIFPMIVFAAKYAKGTHDDFEFVAKPLAALAWLFSLWILNMEVARDMRECWILKVFWAASAAAATAALPTVVIAGEARGFGAVFYAYLTHYVLYLAILFVALRFPHQSRRDSPEWAALAKRAEGVGGKATPADDVLSVAWRARFGRLVALFLPERLLLGGALLAMGLGVPLSAGALVVIGRIFNNFYYPYAPESARGHLREYCLATVGIFAGAALLEGLYSTLVFVAAERMASRTRRKLFHNLLRQDVGFFDAHRAETLVKTVRADVALAQRSLGDHLFHGLHCLLNFSVAVFVMFAISWKMTLVVLSLAPICVLVVRIQRFYARLLGKERADRLARASGFVRECLGALRAVRSFAAEDRKADEYREIVADVYEVSFQSGMVDATSKSSATLIVQFSAALALYVGGVAVLARQVEVGYLVTFAVLAVLAISAMAQLPPLSKQVLRVLAAVDRISVLLDRVPDVAPTGGQVLCRPLLPLLETVRPLSSRR